MNKLIVCVLPLMAACGGGSDSGSGLPGSDPVLADPAPATVVDGCSTAFHIETLGTYDGQFSFQSDFDSCTWEIETTIVGSTFGHADNPQCQMQIDITSSQVDFGVENSRPCTNIDAIANIITPFDQVQAESPPWPVDIFVSLFAETPTRMIAPLGGRVPTNGGVKQFQIRLGGRGNITLPDSHDFEPEWSGVLVKQ